MAPHVWGARGQRHAPAPVVGWALPAGSLAPRKSGASSDPSSSPQDPHFACRAAVARSAPHNLCTLPLSPRHCALPGCIATLDSPPRSARAHACSACAMHCVQLFVAPPPVPGRRIPPSHAKRRPHHPCRTPGSPPTPPSPPILSLLLCSSAALRRFSALTPHPCPIMMRLSMHAQKYTSHSHTECIFPLVLRC